MKKREFNNMTKTSNVNEYALQQNVQQKPPPNYHEYKNQNNLTAINKHVIPNNNKLLMKPETKPVINTLPMLDETSKNEMMKTPPKPSIFSPDNKDTSFYKKSKTDARTPTSKKLSTSPNGRKLETPKKPDVRPQERTPSQQIIKNENRVKSANSAMRLTDTPVIPTISNNPNIPRPISPFISPLKKSNSSRNRTRTSSSSDAELVPVIKKLEDTSDYGDFFRSKLSPQNVDKINPIGNIIKPSIPEISSANGIETNPDLISSLLKESLLGLDNSNSANVNSLQLSMATTTIPNIPNTLEPQVAINDDFKHKSEKKKKKDKHKHKDKTKEERKKHKKDKERSKERQAMDMNPALPVPIKITIAKDKIDMPAEPSIKIKIPKEKIKSLPRNDSGNLDQRPVQGLKIKISKEAVDNYAENSKKRERALSADRGPPAKSTRTT